MELRHLRYFVAVAEELHFGRAAARLQIAQPPLSRQIRRLEEELGLELFHRTKRRVGLTPGGEVFLKKVHQILAQAEQAVRAAQRAGRGEIGELAVGYVGTATYHILPRVLKVFRKRYPDVDLALHEIPPSEQVERLRAGRIQVGFLRSRFNDETLTFESILAEPFVAALPENHRLSSRSRVSVRRLANEPFILFPRETGPTFYDQIVSMCRAAGFSPRVAQEAHDMQTIIGLVAGGMGVALVPESCRNFRRVGVVYKKLRGERATTSLTVAWRRDDTSPILHRFLRIVREAARQES